MKHIKKYIYILPSLCFLVLIFWLCWSNAGAVLSYTVQSLPSGIKEYTQNFENNLSEYLVQKYGFVELNGEVSKVLGIHTLNDIWKLKNGHLTTAVSVNEKGSEVNEQSAKTVASVTAYLTEREIGSLFVLAPEKLQFYDCEPMPGYQKKDSELEDLEKMLKNSGVSCLNMNAWFRENCWSMDDVYFRTDHHWKPEAAFAVAQQIMNCLSQTYEVVCNETMDPENWVTEVYEDWFLGSHGWRTGVRYGGIDDISYIYPSFATDMQVGRINGKRNFLENMTDSIYNLRQLEKPGTYNESVYCLYVGGDYPLVYSRNTLATNDKKVLVVGDSMRLPVEAFLTTQFTELYHIDLRYYQDGTFLEYVNQIEPDFVLFLFNGVSGIYQDYGLDTWNQNYAGREQQKIRQEATINLPLAKSDNHYYIWEVNLSPGNYCVTLDDVTLNRDSEINPKNPGMYLQMTLVDLSTGDIVASRHFLTDYGESQKWLFQVPENVQANYAIQIYNGSNQFTLGNASTITGLSLLQFS